MYVCDHTKHVDSFHPSKVSLESTLFKQLSCYSKMPVLDSNEQWSLVVMCKSVLVHLDGKQELSNLYFFSIEGLLELFIT